jgi:exodeoxyribonuclease-3
MGKEHFMALRVLSYNILVGGENRLPLIANVIQKKQPDVVALIEANSRANSELLAQQLHMNLAFGEANSEFHVAWLSKSPVISAKNHRLPVFSKTLLEIEILWEGISLPLFATHLRAGRDLEHDYYRAKEMQAILNIMRALDGRPHLLVGDLNTLYQTDQQNSVVPFDTGPEGNIQTSPDSHTVIPLLLNAGYSDCFAKLHPNSSGYTYKVPTPILRIDYIFASSNLIKRLHACDVVMGDDAEKASDHFPVWAEFR